MLVTTSLIAMVIISLPYIYGAMRSHPGSFTGVHRINQGDTYSYLAWIEQGRQGHILFAPLYTTENNGPRLFHPIFLVIGLVAKIISLPNIIWYNIARILLGTAFLTSLYIFIKRFVLTTSRSWFIWALVATSSGLGWITHSNVSLDTWMTEAVTFLSLYESVLNISAMLLMLLLYASFLKNDTAFSKKRLAIEALLCNAIILVHPYDIISIFSVLGLYVVYQAFSNRNLGTIKHFMHLTLLTLPAILWQGYVISHNEAFGLWFNMQPPRPAPPLLPLIQTYAPLLPFAFFAWIKHETSNKYILFCALWAGALLMLVYAPLQITFQRKLILGLHIPLAIMAGYILWDIILKIRFTYLRYTTAIAIILLFSYGNLRIAWQDVQAFQTNTQPYYIPSSEHEALDWLKTNTPSRSIVATGSNLGNIIPGTTGQTVYIGHGDQTAFYYAKYTLLRRVLVTEPNQSDPLKTFCKMNGIDYLIIDSEVSSWSSAAFEERDYLKNIYQNAELKIYKVGL